MLQKLISIRDFILVSFLVSAKHATLLDLKGSVSNTYIGVFSIGSFSGRLATNSYSHLLFFFFFYGSFRFGVFVS